MPNKKIANLIWTMHGIMYIPLLFGSSFLCIKLFRTLFDRFELLSYIIPFAAWCGLSVLLYCKVTVPLAAWLKKKYDYDAPRTKHQGPSIYD